MNTETHVRLVRAPATFAGGRDGARQAGPALLAEHAAGRVEVAAVRARHAARSGTRPDGRRQEGASGSHRLRRQDEADLEHGGPVDAGLRCSGDSVAPRGEARGREEPGADIRDERERRSDLQLEAHEDVDEAAARVAPERVSEEEPPDRRTDERMNLPGREEVAAGDEAERLQGRELVYAVAIEEPEVVTRAKCPARRIAPLDDPADATPASENAGASRRTKRPIREGEDHVEVDLADDPRCVVLRRRRWGKIIGAHGLWGEGVREHKQQKTLCFHAIGKHSRGPNRRC